MPTKEAYFNGSTYLRLTTPMPIWDHSAISFRSCRGGEILAQQYNKNSIVISVLNDFLQISLAGPAVHGPNNRLDVKLPYQLLDNRWHTLQFKYEYGNLYLHVDRAASIFGKLVTVLAAPNWISGSIAHSFGSVVDNLAVQQSIWK